MLVGILSILAAAGLTLVDQLIKLWATVELLPVGSKPFIPHVLEFYYLLNDGMSFSMLSGKRTLLVVIAGDRGLAGGYNANVLKLAAQESGNVEVLPIGKRSAEYFAHHEAELFTQEVLLAADISVGQCFQLARQITEGYRKGEFDAVKLCYTRFDSMMTQTAVSIEVLPLAMEPTEQQKAEARRSQILYKPSSEEVFSAIIPEYVAGVVYGAVCESVASELAARRTAMDAATKNAGEMIDHLNLYYNRARQAAITQEITEIVAGAEN